MYSSCCIKSIDEGKAAIQYALIGLQELAEVALVLEETLLRVQEQDSIESLVRAERAAAETKTRAEQARLAWKESERKINAELGTISEELENIKKVNFDTTKRCGDIELQAENLRKQQEMRDIQHTQRNQQRDITLLPQKRVVSLLLVFLGTSDFSRMLQVCSRWSSSLNHPSLWRVVATKRAAIMQKALNERQSEHQFRAPPSTSVQLVINDIKAKKLKAKVTTLPMPLVFKLVLDQVRTALEQTISQRDDLMQRTQTEETVLGFLRTKLNVSRENIGQNRLEIDRWQHAMEVMAGIKDDLAKQLQEQEIKLKATLDKRQQEGDALKSELSKLESRLQLLRDIATFSSHQDADQTMLEHIKELKIQKKMLRKAIKQLRAEEEQLLRERLEFEDKTTLLESRVVSQAS